MRKSNSPSRTPAGEAFFFIADLHALTTEQAPGAVADRTLELATLLLAVGIDPARGPTGHVS